MSADLELHERETSSRPSAWPSRASRAGTGAGVARSTVGFRESSWVLLGNVFRAGIATFGGFISLTGNQLWCMGFDIEGEPFLGQNFTFDDGGGNKCGCPFPPTATCEAVSANLAPPPPATPIE